jgi:hypothetical protein
MEACIGILITYCLKGPDVWKEDYNVILGGNVISQSWEKNGQARGWVQIGN